MPKNFVLDTNVLLHDPRAIFSFADNNVIIPIYVIEEIDTFKKDLSELGRNAREIARSLDSYRDKGRLSEGVNINDKGGRLRVALGGTRTLPAAIRSSQTVNNMILASALEVRDADQRTRTVLVTKDVNLRIRGDAMGLITEDYDASNITVEELYSGSGEVELTSADVNAFYADGSVKVAPNGFHANQFLLLRDRENPTHTALGRFDIKEQKVTAIKKLREGIWGVRPRNKEQHYALDLLLDDNIKLVTLVGKAGTGKTLLALAAGLHKSVEDGTYQKLLVSRPIFPLGRDIGYLPGDIEEKLNPWMQPIYDNIELLLGFVQEREEAKAAATRSSWTSATSRSSR